MRHGTVSFRRIWRVRRTAGFTLLEILVVLMLTSLIMTGLASSLFSLAQTETRVDQRLVADNEIRTSMRFLDQVLGRVSQRTRPGITNLQESRQWFVGRPQQVRWVGIMPARYGAGGRYFFQLGVERAGEFQNLVIRFAPWVDTPNFPDASQMESHILLAGVTQFALQYRGESAETFAWTPEWRRTDFMPSHIMLNISTLNMALPVKIVPMREATGISSGSSLFGVGGNASSSNGGASQ